MQNEEAFLVQEGFFVISPGESSTKSVKSEKSVESVVQDYFFNAK